MNRNDLLIDWPTIWRVDDSHNAGTTMMLQRYEPVQINGKWLYRAQLGAYSTPVSASDRGQFCAVPVRVPLAMQQQPQQPPATGGGAAIVEFVRAELTSVDDTELFIDKVMADSSVYRENFVVYMQTLISQSLDANFLNEIMQEEDDYFLSNVQIVDVVTAERKTRLLSSTTWPKPLIAAADRWPSLLAVSDVSALSGSVALSCAACQQPGVAVRLMFYGDPYDAVTLAVAAGGGAQACGEKVREIVRRGWSILRNLQ